MVRITCFFAALAMASSERGATTVNKTTRADCYISGDPHIRTFDMKKGWTSNVLYAPGTWWLVHTDSGQFQAQATYSQCGPRIGGGSHHQWKSTHNNAAHCLESVALGGSLFEDAVLAIRPPCTWSWGEMTCSDCDANKLPKLTFDGEEVDCTSGKVLIPNKLEICHCTANSIKVKVDGTKVELSIDFFGGELWETATPKTCTANTHGSVHIWMNQEEYGSQCGHCGDNNGDEKNDKPYDVKGHGGDVSPLCKATVRECQQMIPLSAIPKQYGEDGGATSLEQRHDDNSEFCGCQEDGSGCEGNVEGKDVPEACAAAFLKGCGVAFHAESHTGYLEECVIDVCEIGITGLNIAVLTEKDAFCSEAEEMGSHPVCNHCPATD